MDKKSETELVKVKGGDGIVEDDPTECKKMFHPIACTNCEHRIYGFPVDADHCDKGYF